MLATLTPSWQPYVRDKHTVVGNLQHLPKLHSPQLNNERDIYVYLPPSYTTDETKRYPVMYMQDGQNLFDRAIGFMGQEWEVDESMEKLGADGIEAIIVGVPNMGDKRIAEYNPFAGAKQSLGPQYLAFLTDTLKPIIDAEFRTRTEPAHTGLFGSSLGGLISLFGFFHRPDVFGQVGCMSPALWFTFGTIYSYIREITYNPGRIYLDHGTKEPNTTQLYSLLLTRGYRPGQNIRYVKEEGGEHTESAWARRFPNAMRFLLKT